MKRMIIEKPIVIPITINIDYVPSNIAADSNVDDYAVKHPLNIKKRNRLSEGKLIILNDIVMTVLSFIRSRGFIVVKGPYQSKRSYTSYITFIPVDDKGNKSTPIKIEFRIADHISRSMDTDQLEAGDMIIKSFVIGESEYASTSRFIEAMRDILDNLKHGNTDILDKYHFLG